MLFTRKQKSKLSHDLSMFANFLHKSRNQAGSEMHKSIEGMKYNANDMSLESLSDSAGQFHAEMFGRLYEDSEQVDNPGAKWAQEINSVLDELPEFARLQRMTQRDADLASLSTSYVMKHFEETIFRTLSEVEKQVEENILKNHEDGGDRPTTINEIGLSDLSQDVQNSIECNAVAQSISMDQVIEDVKQAKDTMKALGVGAGTNNDTGERQSFIKKTKSTEIHQDRAPKELTRERMLACHDDTWDNYCFRFATRKQWKRRKENGIEKVGKGPITICLDISSSMQGDNIDWAKSFVLALYSIAKDENRKVQMCTYNRSLQRTDYDLGSNYIELLNRIIAIDAHGGTSFDPPISWAMNNVQAKGDIVFITDGSASVSNSLLNKFKSKIDECGARFFTVYLEHCHNPQLRSISNLEIDLKNVMSDQSADRAGQLLRVIKDN